MKTMGDIISFNRKEKGMTQAALAAQMNVTDKAVSKWERNLSCPDINSIPKLAEILGISVNDLLSATQTDNKKSEVCEIIGVILKAIPLAMGVATVVLSVLNKTDISSAFIMLGVGLICLSAGALSNNAK